MDYGFQTRLAAPTSESSEAELIALVVNGLNSQHSIRSYRTGLGAFFAWVRSSSLPPTFSKGLVQRYRSSLLTQGLSPSTINLRLSPIRKLAQEMADNGLLDPGAAAAISRVPGVKKLGRRAGNWLTLDQANRLLDVPSAETLAGRRDRAILALLLNCGLRRSELVRLKMEDLQQREGRWVLADMVGKGSRIRTVTVPAGVKQRLDDWTESAAISSGPIFRPVSKSGTVSGSGIRDEKAVWRLVLRYSRMADIPKLAPHDLRRTCAKLCRKAGGELEQIQMLLGHSSIQTTEHYLGTEQEFGKAVNDTVGLEFCRKTPEPIPNSVRCHIATPLRVHAPVERNTTTYRLGEECANHFRLTDGIQVRRSQCEG